MSDTNTLVDIYQVKQDELKEQIELDRKLVNMFIDDEPTEEEFEALHELETMHARYNNYHLAKVVRDFINSKR